MDEKIELQLIGYVKSTLQNIHGGPKMEGTVGAVDATIQIDPQYTNAMLGMEVGQEIWLLTWLHQADRTVLQHHPRRDLTRPLRGVFTSRSPDRPNPIGIHHTKILKIDGNNIQVQSLEVIDGTPVIDIKIA